MDFTVGVFAILWLLFFALIIPFLLVYVVCAVAQMLLMQRAGSDKAWSAWVPVYNTWTFLELGKQPGWAALAVFGALLLSPIPLIGELLYFLASIFLLITYIFAVVNVNKQFNKDSGGWHVFGVLLFPIWAFALYGEKTEPNTNVPGQLEPITDWFKKKPEYSNKGAYTPMSTQDGLAGPAYQPNPNTAPTAPYAAAPQADSVVYTPETQPVQSGYENLVAAEPVNPVPPPPVGEVPVEPIHKGEGEYPEGTKQP